MSTTDSATRKSGAAAVSKSTSGSGDPEGARPSVPRQDKRGPEAQKAASSSATDHPLPFLLHHPDPCTVLPTPRNPGGLRSGHRQGHGGSPFLSLTHQPKRLSLCGPGRPGMALKPSSVKPGVFGTLQLMTLAGPGDNGGKPVTSSSVGGRVSCPSEGSVSHGSSRKT